MDLTYSSSVRAPKAVPVLVFKQPTADGARSQIHVVIEFQDSQGTKLERRTLVFGDGAVQEWVNRGWLTPPEPYDPDTNPTGYNPADHDDMPWVQYKFKQLWDMVPEVDQAVLNLLDTKLPQQAIEQLWEKGR